MWVCHAFAEPNVGMRPAGSVVLCYVPTLWRCPARAFQTAQSQLFSWPCSNRGAGRCLGLTQESNTNSVLGAVADVMMSSLHAEVIAVCSCLYATDSRLPGQPAAGQAGSWAVQRLQCLLPRVRGEQQRRNHHLERCLVIPHAASSGLPSPACRPLTTITCPHMCCRR